MGSNIELHHRTAFEFVESYVICLFPFSNWGSCEMTAPLGDLEQSAVLRRVFPWDSRAFSAIQAESSSDFPQDTQHLSKDSDSMFWRDFNMLVKEFRAVLKRRGRACRVSKGYESRLAPTFFQRSSNPTSENPHLFQIH